MTSEYADTITVTDFEGLTWDLVWITDEDDPDGTLVCQMCGDPLMAGYGAPLGDGGYAAWCVECCPSVFKAPAD